ncbi:unnamed protein product [Ophioblennius macclurei]
MQVYKNRGEQLEASRREKRQSLENTPAEQQQCGPTEAEAEEAEEAVQDLGQRLGEKNDQEQVQADNFLQSTCVKRCYKGPVPTCFS